MATQMQLAKQGKITDEMKLVAENEGVSSEFIREGVKNGTIAICANINHLALVPCGVGKGLRTKVNANIGTSEHFPDIDSELKKLTAVIRAGVDSVMDLSTGTNIDLSRKCIIDKSPIMVGTVPIYQATVEATAKYGAVVKMTADDLLHTIECQAKDGADFITLHCGITREAIRQLRTQGREMNIVSRGGSFISCWMLHNEAENPLYEFFDDILDICECYDVTISLGDGLRPGCIADATDRAQIMELINLGELIDRAWQRGVQVMVEGPGHVPYHEIAANVQLQKSMCRNAPFYVLGPLPTDIAPGYDHITGAIGGALAASKGADFLCYVTPAEHLGLPTIEDVHAGVMATRIAAHIADIAKGVHGASHWDLKMARARKRLDWDEQLRLAIDSDLAAAKRASLNKDEEEACSMCGSFCAVKIIGDYL